MKRWFAVSSAVGIATTLLGVLGLYFNSITPPWVDALVIGLMALLLGFGVFQAFNKPNPESSSSD